VLPPKPAATNARLTGALPSWRADLKFSLHSVCSWSSRCLMGESSRRGQLLPFGRRARRGAAELSGAGELMAADAQLEGRQLTRSEAPTDGQRQWRPWFGCARRAAAERRLGRVGWAARAGSVTELTERRRKGRLQTEFVEIRRSRSSGARRYERRVCDFQLWRWLRQWQSERAGSGSAAG